MAEKIGDATKMKAAVSILAKLIDCETMEDAEEIIQVVHKLMELRWPTLTCPQ
jgi:hypothetical protein